LIELLMSWIFYFRAPLIALLQKAIEYLEDYPNLVVADLSQPAVHQEPYHGIKETFQPQAPTTPPRRKTAQKPKRGFFDKEEPQAPHPDLDYGSDLDLDDLARTIPEPETLGFTSPRGPTKLAHIPVTELDAPSPATIGRTPATPGSVK
jgi:hypothetical protein